jgi:predicted metal-binding membrane protein
MEDRENAVEWLLRRDSAVIAVALLLVVLVAGWHTWSFAHAMANMQMTAPMPWTPATTAAILLMWVSMMAAMMLPSAAPVVLLYARHCGRRADAFGAYVPTGLFVAGYLAVWTGFAALATALQWLIDWFGWLSAEMAIDRPLIAGLALAAAGVYQLTPAKRACLAHCRGPVAFLAMHWRPGPLGALRMGVVHGLYCLGCCWVLMLVLFVGGAMNLAVVLALAGFIAVEKWAPHGSSLSRAMAAVLIALGAVLTTL